MVHQMVARHAVEPGGERALRFVVALQSLKYFDEDLLGQVFGFGAAAGETVTQIENFPGVRAEKRLPCGVVAPHAPLHQLPVLFHAGLPQSLPPNARAARNRCTS